MHSTTTPHTLVQRTEAEEDLLDTAELLCDVVTALEEGRVEDAQLLPLRGVLVQVVAVLESSADCLHHTQPDTAALRRAEARSWRASLSRLFPTC